MRRRFALLAAAGLAATATAAAPQPVTAHHGTFHADLHAEEFGGSTYSVRAHSRCSTNCNAILAAVLDGSWMTSLCDLGGDACFEVYSPQRVVVAGNRQHRHFMQANPHVYDQTHTSYLP